MLPRRQAIEHELLPASFALATAHNCVRLDLDPEALVDGDIAGLFQLGHAFEWFVHAASPSRICWQREAGGGLLSKPPLVTGLQRAQKTGVTWVSPFVGAERRDASREPWNLIRLKPA